MESKWIKRGVAGGVIALVAAGVAYALWPQPVAVDIAAIDRGDLGVTIDEEGVARVRDVFRVSAPIGGRLDRLPVDTGDQVIANATEIAFIRPTDPPFLDIRTRRELEAAAEAAHAAVALAEAQLNGAETAGKMAEADLARTEQLARTGTISERTLEKAESDAAIARAALGQATAGLALRQSELAGATARLIEPDQRNVRSANFCCLAVRSPVSGTVIQLITENEQVVAAGTPLLEIGNPRDLEIIVHLLSTDAVGISPGTAAVIDGWGGPPLPAKIVRIDPAAYTKVSALGIEEQRVDATLALTAPQETWKALGHEFRIMAHISVWHGADVVRVPLGAIFRQGSEWTVYRVIDGRAATTPIVIDHRNSEFAEVRSGLSAGDQVVLHPSDRVTEGTAIAARDHR